MALGTTARRQTVRPGQCNTLNIVTNPGRNTLLTFARAMYPASRARQRRRVEERKVPDETVDELEAAGRPFNVTKASASPTTRKDRYEGCLKPLSNTGSKGFS